VTSIEPTNLADGRVISVVAVLRAAKAHKRVVALTTVVVVALAVTYALLATPRFEASVVVTDTRDPTFGSSANLGGQLGGLAGLASSAFGLSDQDHEREAVLVSKHLMSEFIARNNLLPVLLPEPAKRSQWFAVQKLSRSILDINEDKVKGTTTVSVMWTDPKVAADWANGYVALANELVRERALVDATKAVDYLKKQAEATSSVEIQRVMYDLIETQTKKLVLANAREEYAFTIVDPAVPPEIRTTPKRTLTAISGMVIGLLLGAIVAFLYDRFHARSPDL
jgi:LPS O-antigen subunit length determinant protein (WzzB/FepE family)